MQVCNSRSKAVTQNRTAFEMRLSKFTPKKCWIYMLRTRHWIILFPVYQERMLNLTPYKNALLKLMNSKPSKWALALQKLALSLQLCLPWMHFWPIQSTRPSWPSTMNCLEDDCSHNCPSIVEWPHWWKLSSLGSLNIGLFRRITSTLQVFMIGPPITL